MSHTTDQLRGGARDFCTVLDQVPAAFMWESYLSGRLAGTSIGPNALEALRNATIESSLLSVRLLNDFFAPRRYPTDIRAEDYVGYASPSQFLTSEEARALNKHLAHLTTERADAFPKGWSIYDMIRRCHAAAVTFIRFLASPQGQQYRPDIDLDSRIQTCERIEPDMRRFLNQPMSGRTKKWISKLNGWQRMWVIVAVIWAVVLWIPFPFLMWSAPDAPHWLRERQAQITAKAKVYEAAHPHPPGEWHAPDNEILALKEDANEYFELDRKIKNYPHDLLVHICNSAAVWAGPLITIYLLGLGVGWVRAGFRKAASD